MRMISRLAVVVTVVGLAVSALAEEAVHVTVLGVGEGVLEARAKRGAKVLRLATPEKKGWLIRGLAKDDKIAVSYETDGEKLVLTEVKGGGLIIGNVAKIEKVFITVETRDGVKHRLMPKWIGGMPKDGGGHDKKVLEQIHAVKVGQRVRLRWTIEEGKRVTSVEATGGVRK